MFFSKTKTQSNISRLRQILKNRPRYGNTSKKYYCLHKFKTGYGMMGDAWRCSKCGLDKYPEALPEEFKIFYIKHNRVSE